MNIIKITAYTVTIISFLLAIYMLGDLFYKKIKLKKGKIKYVDNTKYIVIMMILIVLFVVYGLLRNFI